MSNRIFRSLPVALLVGAFLTCGVMAQGTERGFFPPQQAGAGGGPYYAAFQLSIPELDSRLAEMGLEGLPEWISLFGAGGSIQMGSLMIGGFTLVGAVQRSGTAAGIERKARLDLSYGGLTVGYVKAMSNLKLTLGGAIGTGRLVLKLNRFPQTGRSWDGTWQYYAAGFTGTVDAGSLDTSAELSGNYFFLEPFFGIRYWLMPLVAFDLNAFYRLGRIGAGKLESIGESIADSPALDLSGMGLRVGLFLGF